MPITHVFRGEEWLSSTPKHILLYEAFMWEPPQYIHLPTILDEHKKKLSKREGAASVMDFRAMGYLPEALFNYLALLGWAPTDNREEMSKEELISAFSISRINAKAAVFDMAKLTWMNGLYMAKRSSEDLLYKVIPYWFQLARDGKLEIEDRLLDLSAPEKKAYLLRVIDLMKVRSKKIDDLATSFIYFLQDPETYEDNIIKRVPPRDLIASLIIFLSDKSFTADNLRMLFEEIVSKEKHTTLGDLVHPTRLALTGVTVGPGLFELMEVLGKETVLRRLRKFLSAIKGEPNEESQ